MRAVVNDLGYKTEGYTTEDRVVFRGDPSDPIDKIWDTLDEHREIVEDLHAARDSVSSNHTSKTMRILTVATTIMMPLTLVASIYGMNIALPKMGNESSFVSFIILISIMLVAIVAMLLFFHSRRWI
jgi:magnesium transporter